jgi:hypothetical protein
VPTTSVWPRWFLAAAAAAVAFALGQRLGRVETALPAPTAAPAVLEAPPLPSFTRLTYRAGGVASARFAPDGANVVFGAFFGDEPLRMHVVRTDNPAARSLDIEGDVLAVSQRGEVAVSLSRRMAWWPAEGTLAVAPLLSGTPRPVRDDVLAADYDVSGELVIASRAGATVHLERPPGTTIFSRRAGLVTFASPPPAWPSCITPMLVILRGSLR